jgi:glutamate 5-kinase
VSIVAPDGKEIARGLINYSATEVRQIRGCRSPRIAEILGQRPYDEVVHRDNMTVIAGQPATP